MRLLTAPTPNGWKVSIMIEELREAGHPLEDLEVEYVNIMKGEQFEPAFTRVGPNQKIPALADAVYAMPTQTKPGQPKGYPPENFGKQAAPAAARPPQQSATDLALPASRSGMMSKVPSAAPARSTA